MRTLVHCTAYAETPHDWQMRTRRWLDALPRAALGADQVLIVDDGSPVLPGWPDLQISTCDVLGEAFTAAPGGATTLFHFRQRLGRHAMNDFPGWHRSYVFAALYAEAHGFGRVIHVESDAFLIGPRACAFLAGVTDGWASLFSPRFGMPELAISVAAGSGLRRLAEFARQPYAALRGRMHEQLMPFTHVERGLTGDRYGQEVAPVPHGADYATQIPSQREPGYYWWLTGAAGPAAPAHSATLRLTAGFEGGALLEEGWAPAEPRHRWMLGAESTLRLPPLRGPGAGVLRLGVTPFVVPGRLARQRLAVLANEQRVGAFEFGDEAVLGCAVPPGLLRHDGTDRLRFIHPDAGQPCRLDPGSADARRLSVSLEWLTLEA